MTIKNQTMQKQVNAITAKIHNLDTNILRLEELVESLEVEGIITDEVKFELAYSDYLDTICERAVEENKFIRLKGRLLLLCKETYGNK